MNIKPIHISRDDYNRLKKMIEELSSSKIDAIEKLQMELDRAIVDEEEVPSNVVAINSRVSIRDLDTKDLEEYVLTMPEKARLEEGRISILAPIGTALLGFAEGDEVSWETPGGERHFRIETVAPAEPEAATVPPYFPEYLLGVRSTA